MNHDIYIIDAAPLLSYWGEWCDMYDNLYTDDIERFLNFTFNIKTDQDYDVLIQHEITDTLNEILDSIFSDVGLDCIKDKIISWTLNKNILVVKTI